MANLLSGNQYYTTTLNVGGGINSSQTTGIILSGVSGLDITKPSIALINYSDPVNTTIAEWIEYSSINGSNELQGVVRGSEGFSAKSHDNGVTIAFPLSESHINRIVAKLDGTDTGAYLSQARITPRVNTVTSSATPTVNADTTDIFTITALATAITSMTTNLSGTPVNGQKLTYRIKDDGTARAITWGASFASLGATLPTTTVISTTLYVDFIYNSTSAKWECMKTSGGSGSSVTDEDNTGTSSTSSATLANITGADVSVTTTVTSNIILTANVIAYGNVALAPYTIQWHDGSTVIGTTATVYLAASNARTNVSLQTIVTNKAAGTYTYTLQHKSNDGSSSLTADTINLTAVAIPA